MACCVSDRLTAMMLKSTFRKLLLEKCPEGREGYSVDYGLKPTWPPCIHFREDLYTKTEQQEKGSLLLNLLIRLETTFKRQSRLIITFNVAARGPAPSDFIGKEFQFKKLLAMKFITRIPQYY